MEVGDGEIVTLIGSNGAGKSTTLHTISGLIKPKTGSILYKGNEIVGIPAHNWWDKAWSRSRKAAMYLQK